MISTHGSGERGRFGGFLQVLVPAGSIFGARFPPLRFPCQTSTSAPLSLSLTTGGVTFFGKGVLLDDLDEGGILSIFSFAGSGDRDNVRELGEGVGCAVGDRRRAGGM